MNENIKLSNYTASIRIGDRCQFVDMDYLAVICDKFLFEELCDFVAQSPVGTIIYSGYRNKTPFVIQINPKAS